MALTSNNLQGEVSVMTRRALREEDQQRLDHAIETQVRQFKVLAEWRASLPYNQFDDQIEEELERILKEDQDGTCSLPAGTNMNNLARENVKRRWVEQGIWNPKWNDYTAVGVWKHEDPLEIESKSDTDTEAEPQRSGFTLFSKQPFTFPKEPKPKSDEEKRQIAERRALREREREASRPFNQFLWQVSKECEQLQAKSSSGGDTSIAGADIGTKAYQNVKDTWVKRGIWNTKWGILPGGSWKHEEELDRTVEPTMTIHPSIVAMITEVVGAGPVKKRKDDTPRKRWPPVFPRVLPEEPDLFWRLACIAQEGQSADMNLTQPGNDNVDFSPNSSPSPATGGRQASHSATYESSGQDKQSRLVSSMPLGPIHSSKVSKSPTKKRPGHRRQPDAFKGLSSSGATTSTRLDIAGTVFKVAETLLKSTCTSKQSQSPESTIAKDQAGTTTPTDSLSNGLNGAPNLQSEPTGPGNPESI